MWCFCLSIIIDKGCAQNTTTESSLFQCEPTTDLSGQFFTPNISDLYFDDFSLAQQENLTTLSVQRGTMLIFTTPPESTCNGTVLAFEFCYLALNDEIGKIDRDVFRFVSLSRNGLQFTITDFDSIRIRTSPRDAICSLLVPFDGRYICCDTYTLPDDEQFQIPSSNYTFGVVIRTLNKRMPFVLDAEFRFPHFQARPIDNNNGPEFIGISFTLTEDDLQSESSLLLLRLIGT